MANQLLDAIGAVGNVVDTPGSVLRGLLAAPFTGQWDRPLAGIFDPSKRVHGSEWTGEPISGAVLDIALDPLNVLGAVGAAKAGKALGKMQFRKVLTSELAKGEKIADATKAALKEHILEGKMASNIIDSPFGAIDTAADVNKTYNPEVIKALPWMPRARIIKRAHPDLAKHVEDLGLGYRLPPDDAVRGFEGAGGSQGLVSNMAPWEFDKIARVRGGHAKLAGNPRDPASLLNPKPMLVDIEKGIVGAHKNPGRMPLYSGQYADEFVNSGGVMRSLDTLPIDQAAIAAGSSAAGISQGLSNLGKPGKIEILMALAQRLGIPVESLLARSAAGVGLPLAARMTTIPNYFKEMQPPEQEAPPGEWAPDPLPKMMRTTLQKLQGSQPR